MTSRATAAAALVAAVIAAILYWPVRSYRFTYDDEGVIETGTYIKNWQNFFKIYEYGQSKHFGAMTDPQRPVCNLTLFADYSLYGDRPDGYHTTNLIFHAACSGLAAVLAAELGLDLAGCLAAGVLFAVLGVHVEPVAQINYREDLLACLFGVLCFIAYIRRSTALSLIALIFALGSKESAVAIFPALLALEIRASGYRGAVRMWRKWILHAAVLIGYLACLAWLSKLSQHPAVPLDRFRAMVAAFGTYAKLLFVPWPLNPDYVLDAAQPWITPWITPWIVAGFAGFCTAALGAVLLLRRWGTASFGILLLVFTLLPVSNLVPIYRPISERYLYFGSLGFALAAGHLISRIWRVGGAYRTPIRAISLSLYIVFAGGQAWAAYSQMPVWKDENALWTRTTEVSPRSFRAWEHIGTVKSRAGDRAGAVLAYSRAIEINPKSEKVMNDLGICAMEAGDLKEAKKWFRNAIELRPRYVIGICNFASVLMRENHLDNARKMLEIALKINPRSMPALFHMARLSLTEGNTDHARGYLSQCLSINPSETRCKMLRDELKKQSKWEPPGGETPDDILSDEPAGPYSGEQDTE